ncbi:hypothetical protein MMC25_005219 [Agyrium rufum]|nr:hypothetical protein [Agyrium rufum]
MADDKRSPSLSEPIPLPHDAQEAVKNRYPGIPRFVYGTAFKEHRSAEVVALALKHGFQGVDTACALKNYDEEDVGEGIREALENRYIKRRELFIQTKHSPWVPGKDRNNYPYDTTASLEDQVHQSIASSLTKLSTSASGSNDGNDSKPSSGVNDYIDNLTLHSPLPTIPETIRVYKVMETYVPKRISTLGLSNVDLPTLRAVYEAASPGSKPLLVQNRFTQDTDQSLPYGAPKVAYDADVRVFCEEKGVVYQAWGTLWGNPQILETAEGLGKGEGGKVAEGGKEGVVGKVMRLVRCEKEMALYFLVLGLGKVSMLVGTRQEERMKRVHEGVRKFEDWIAEDGNAEIWKDVMIEFRGFIGND